MLFYEGERGAERIVREESVDSDSILFLEGERGAERYVRQAIPYTMVLAFAIDLPIFLIHL